LVGGVRELVRRRGRRGAEGEGERGAYVPLESYENV
jgi:hypothetical protein